MSLEDFLILLSDAGGECLDLLAQKASATTRRSFGNSIILFTPLYIANYCQNSCAYCSFAKTQSIVRRQLTFDEIRREAEAIGNTGIRHVLVLSGEAPTITTFEYLTRSLEIISGYFSSVGIELYPLQEQEYGFLISTGLIDSLTLYQETYDEAVYRQLHPAGPKSDYEFRLEAPDRACRQQIHAVTIGALLGLSDVRKEAYALAIHAQYLQNTYPGVELSLSFPRLRPMVSDFKAHTKVTDRQLVQLMCAFRLLFPSAGITLSTRESIKFRDGVMRLGITKVSAGVSTAVGGHGLAPSTAQFEIADTRSVAAMKNDLRAAGFQPVTQDWNMKLTHGTPLIKSIQQ